MKLHKDLDNFSLKCGGFAEFFNEKIFINTGVDDTYPRREMILDAHIIRHTIFGKALDCKSDDFVELATCRDALRLVEFQLQSAWGFPSDANFHSYWYNLPHCTCPRMDNYDARGEVANYINSGCPVHGEKSVGGEAWIEHDGANPYQLLL